MPTGTLSTMQIRNLFRQGRPLFSIELFPPKTPQGVEKLKARLGEIKPLRPDFISVTYGAGGGTRHTTGEICAYIKQDLGLEVLAHLTCVAHTPEETRGMLDAYRAMGVDNIMALRGDPPQEESSFKPRPGGFCYAVDLVRAVQGEDHFGVGVAGYPEGHIESPDYPTDLAHQVDKIAAGADFVVSQFFLDNSHFFKWRDDLRRAGVKVPVVAGILPPQNLEQINRFAGFCGVSIPEPLHKELARFPDDPQAAAEAGLAHSVRQVEELLAEGVDGIHLYALNRLAPIRTIGPMVTTVE